MIFPGRKVAPASLTDISSHADDTSSEAHHGALAARAASAGPKRVPRVDSPPNHIVDGLANHERLRHTGLDIKYSASFTKQMCENGIFGVVFSDPANVPHVSFVALCEISNDPGSIVFNEFVP